ncbi:MAG: nitroreductase [Thermodesulfobacteriota bacterium]|nr:nitroreductase [Thermodesulfobacteriota bacterium]
MDIKEAIKMRKSIRGYKADPIPKDILHALLEISLRSPSAMNTQPWEIAVITGEPLENIRKGTIEALTSGQMPVSDLPQGKSFEGIYKERQRELGFELYGLMGIAREDKEKRNEWTMKGLRTFEAPAIIIISADESLDISRTFCDIGALIQTICITAVDYGLGTCINGQGIMFPQVIRKFVPIPESKKMYMCISIGYPDWEHPANKLESRREPLETNTTWYGFDS